MTVEELSVEVFRGTAAAFHAADLLADLRPRLVVCAATDMALVLGSRQQLDIVDVDACRAAGVEVVKRRSGGGLVFVAPSAMRWFDIVVPATDPRFEAVAADVTASMRWAGEHLRTALERLGVAGTVHDSTMTGGRLAQLVCFAGLGPGEVLLGGRKLVGISQRRTRQGSRFQCMVHVRWSPETLLGLLAEPRPDVAELPPVAVVTADVAAALPGAVARVLTDATD